MLRLLLVAGLLAIASCSSRSSDCDPTSAVCPCQSDLDCASGSTCSGGVCARPGEGGPGAPDGGVTAPPGRQLGETCKADGDCASQRCVVVGTGKMCTDACTGSSCPDGFGCVGVDPGAGGARVDLCVPVSNQLCDSCERDA